MYIFIYPYSFLDFATKHKIYLTCWTLTVGDWVEIIEIHSNK